MCGQIHLPEKSLAGQDRATLEAILLDLSGKLELSPEEVELFYACQEELASTSGNATNPDN